MCQNGSSDMTFIELHTTESKDTRYITMNIMKQEKKEVGAPRRGPRLSEGPTSGVLLLAGGKRLVSGWRSSLRARLSSQFFPPNTLFSRYC